MTALGRLRQFSRMKAVFHAMLSGIEQLVSGLSGRAAIGVTICWMSGIGRGSRIDSLSRVSQISLHLTTCSIKQMTALGRLQSNQAEQITQRQASFFALPSRVAGTHAAHGSSADSDAVAGNHPGWLQ